MRRSNGATRRTAMQYASGQSPASPAAARLGRFRGRVHELDLDPETRRIVIHAIAIGELQKDWMRKLAAENGGVFVDLGS
jgi:hypothetical protein